MPYQSFEELLETVKIEPVLEAMNATWQVSDAQRRLARETLVTALEKWLLSDYQKHKLLKIEQEFNDGRLKGYIDLLFESEDGKRVGVDWKTCQGSLDWRWAQNYKDSWQWKLYAALADLDVFVFRGVAISGETKDIVLPVPASNKEEVENYLGENLKLINELIASPFVIWSKNMPGACNKWGRKCLYYEDCRNGTEDRSLPSLRTMSYTRLNTFNLCRERFRRDLLLADKTDTLLTDDTEDAAFGRAVHRGLAEVYSQVFGVSYEIR